MNRTVPRLHFRGEPQFTHQKFQEIVVVQASVTKKVVDGKRAWDAVRTLAVGAKGIFGSRGESRDGVGDVGAKNMKTLLMTHLPRGDATLSLHAGFAAHRAGFSGAGASDDVGVGWVELGAQTNTN